MSMHEGNWESLGSQREVYVVRVRWTGKIVHLLWYYGEPDGVIVDPNKRIVTNSSREEIENFATESGMIVSKDDSAVYDFDYLRKWIRNPTVTRIIPKLFLNSWNMFDDIKASVRPPDNNKVLRDDEDHAYEALFRCSGEAAETIYGKNFEPYFTYTDILAIQQVMTQGLSLVASCM